MKASKSHKKLVIFDWDGTLMNSADYIVSCVQRTTRDLNLPEPSSECIRQGVGLGFADQLKNLFSEEAKNIDAVVFRQHYEDYFYEHFNNNGPKLMEGTMTLLQTLRMHGFLLAIATSMQKTVLEVILEHTGITDLFNARRCGDQTLSKPHPQMLFEILAELKVEPGDALMVGDTEYDMCMAQRAHMDCIAVSYGAHDIKRLRKYNPIACIDKPLELLAVVNKMDG